MGLQKRRPAAAGILRCSNSNGGLSKTPVQAIYCSLMLHSLRRPHVEGQPTDDRLERGPPLTVSFKQSSRRWPQGHVLDEQGEHATPRLVADDIEPNSSSGRTSSKPRDIPACNGISTWQVFVSTSHAGSDRAIILFRAVPAKEANQADILDASQDPENRSNVLGGRGRASLQPVGGYCRHVAHLRESSMLSHR